MLSSFIFIAVIFFFSIAIRIFSLKKILEHGKMPSCYAGTDISTQFFYFIKTLTQNSLCPSEYSNRYPKAALYYPLGIYWIAINIAAKFKKPREYQLHIAISKTPIIILLLHSKS